MEANLSNDPSPILALTILDGNTLNAGAITPSTKMLFAVRRPQTNKTHPNVISVPTQRIPEVLFQALEQYGRVEYYDEITNTLLYQGTNFNNDRYSGHNPIIFAVEALMSTKLGVAELLESRSIRFTASVRAVLTATVYHPDHEEDTRMMNILTVISNDPDLFPKETASYFPIGWSDIRTFIETASQKDPLLLDPNLDPITYCIHGLCIASSYNIVAHSLGLDFYQFSGTSGGKREQD